MFAVLIGVAVALFVVGVPIYMVLALGATAGFLAGDLPVVAVYQRFVTGIDSFIFVSLPLYVGAAVFMVEGGAVPAIMRFVQSLIGRVPGSSAHVNIGGSVLFAGISGSALADAAGAGRMLLPPMIERGWPPAKAAAITGASSIIGPIIPPSVVMIIYGALSQTSILALFLGGVIPGLLIAGALSAYSYVEVRRGGFDMQPDFRWSFTEVRQSLVGALPALIVPVVIFAGLFNGAVTVTEAGALGAVTSLVVASVFYRGIRLGNVLSMLRTVGVSTAAIAVIVGISSSWSWVVSIQRVPERITEWLGGVTQSPVLLLLLVVVVMLVVGAFVESTAAIVVFAPILTPIALAVGLDPVHFGLVLMLSLLIGLLTPPFGLVLYVVTDISGASLGAVIRATVPYVGALLFVTVLVVFVPGLVTWIPSLLAD
jgi:tripartite ATP-independent transporter DctM subunit